MFDPLLSLNPHLSTFCKLKKVLLHLHVSSIYIYIYIFDKKEILLKTRKQLQVQNRTCCNTSHGYQPPNKKISPQANWKKRVKSTSKFSPSLASRSALLLASLKTCLMDVWGTKVIKCLQSSIIEDTTVFAFPRRLRASTIDFAPSSIITAWTLSCWHSKFYIYGSLNFFNKYIYTLIKGYCFGFLPSSCL